MSSIKAVKAAIEQHGCIRIDCGKDSFRVVECAKYRNSTEAALAAIETAKFAPYVCCSEAGECNCHISWESRLFQ